MPIPHLLLSVELAHRLIEIFSLAKDIKAVSAVLAQCFDENIVISSTYMMMALEAIQANNDHKNHSLIMELFHIFMNEKQGTLKNSAGNEPFLIFIVHEYEQGKKVKPVLLIMDTSSIMKLMIMDSILFHHHHHRRQL